MKLINQYYNKDTKFRFNGQYDGRWKENIKTKRKIKKTYEKMQKKIIINKIIVYKI